ncbi:unnamed protein product [Urochloa humidicola]
MAGRRGGKAGRPRGQPTPAAPPSPPSLARRAGTESGARAAIPFRPLQPASSRGNATRAGFPEEGRGGGREGATRGGASRRLRRLPVADVAGHYANHGDELHRLQPSRICIEAAAATSFSCAPLFLSL